MALPPINRAAVVKYATLGVGGAVLAGGFGSYAFSAQKNTKHSLTATPGDLLRPIGGTAAGVIAIGIGAREFTKGRPPLSAAAIALVGVSTIGCTIGGVFG